MGNNLGNGLPGHFKNNVCFTGKVRIQADKLDQLLKQRYPSLKRQLRTQASRYNIKLPETWEKFNDEQKCTALRLLAQNQSYGILSKIAISLLALASLATTNALDTELKQQLRRAGIEENDPLKLKNSLTTFTDTNIEAVEKMTPFQDIPGTYYKENDTYNIQLPLGEMVINTKFLLDRIKDVNGNFISSVSKSIFTVPKTHPMYAKYKNKIIVAASTRKKHENEVKKFLQKKGWGIREEEVEDSIDGYTSEGKVMEYEVAEELGLLQGGKTRFIEQDRRFITAQERVVSVADVTEVFNKLSRKYPVLLYSVVTQAMMRDFNMIQNAVYDELNIYISDNHWNNWCYKFEPNWQEEMETYFETNDEEGLSQMFQQTMIPLDVDRTVRRSVVDVLTFPTLPFNLITYTFDFDPEENPQALKQLHQDIKKGKSSFDTTVSKEPWNGKTFEMSTFKSLSFGKKTIIKMDNDYAYIDSKNYFKRAQSKFGVEIYRDGANKYYPLYEWTEGHEAYFKYIENNEDRGILSAKAVDKRTDMDGYWGENEDIEEFMKHKGISFIPSKVNKLVKLPQFGEFVSLNLLKDKFETYRQRYNLDKNLGSTVFRGIHNRAMVVLGVMSECGYIITGNNGDNWGYRMDEDWMNTLERIMKTHKNELNFEKLMDIFYRNNFTGERFDKPIRLDLNGKFEKKQLQYSDVEALKIFLPQTARTRLRF